MKWLVVIIMMELQILKIWRATYQYFMTFGVEISMEIWHLAPGEGNVHDVQIQHFSRPMIYPVTSWLKNVNAHWVGWLILRDIFCDWNAMRNVMWSVVTMCWYLDWNHGYLLVSITIDPEFQSNLSPNRWRGRQSTGNNFITFIATWLNWDPLPS